MDSIYINNFRGFSKTVVPIRSVNFFVGENSTGKTSLLALIELLSRAEFWFNLDFNAGNYEFGGYRDIISALSGERSEFQIGLYKYDQKDPEDSVCYLLHFREAKDGTPRLARFSQLHQNYNATLRVSNKQLAVRVSYETPSFSHSLSPHNYFEFLQEEATRRTSGYKVYSSDKELFMLSPITSFPAILRDLTKHDNVKIKPKSFPFPLLTRSFASMAPIRTTPKRTYDGYTKHFSPEGEHTPYVIRKRLPRGKKASNAFKLALETFGQDSGLFQTVGVTRFGKDSAAPFELTVTLGTKPLRVNSVGYGVSQVLPVVVELLTHGKNSTLSIQQPEVHLHPKAQAALGDILFHAATDESHTLFVETHSDYLLDRFRLSMQDHKHPNGFAQVCFFERTEDGNHIYPMVIDSSGEYPDDQPPGFRSFFLAEQKRIIGV